MSEVREVNELDGRLLVQLTHSTAPIELVVSGNHRELIRLCVITSPLSTVVIGLTWLERHNPQIDWVANKIVSWSPFCHSHCLRAALAPSQVALTPKP